MVEEEYVDVFIDLKGLKNLIKIIDQFNQKMEESLAKNEKHVGCFKEKIGDVILKHANEYTYQLKIPIVQDDPDETYINFPNMRLFLNRPLSSAEIGLDGFDIYKTLTKEELQGLCKKYLESEEII